MKIRPLLEKDRAKLLAILRDTHVFMPEEVSVAMELIDIVLRDSNQRDYTVYCLVDDEDQPLGYICYGPAPMTQGAYDLYWIAVDPGVQNQGIGSKLLDFMEETLKNTGGRMILVDTSSMESYEPTRRFYFGKGFQEAARIADYYFQGNDRITFCKRLL